ncbi:hypothetical protein [Mycobacterium angelicum]|uniref:Uncharacterized protein n=1 Tax=Mycobacterium angelicum TaxID=470074 RepID=A0A1X0A8W9_MYCAN|nr:hypothetical protein [Mycobacterium angelicum]MCV7197605.1 hypothetical protein [Mycobacterium angelicum]ORA26483.1 hypothetical protein BST12_01005 [Mycobacterium angelicum]
MTKFRTPLDAVTAVLQNPVLPDGADERFVGFGVMGLPFASGHYLALRDFPAASFAPAYRSVWHRDPNGSWTFYATTPGPQSCSRYFSTVTPNAAVQCDIDVAWVTPWSLFVGIAGLLEWEIDIRATASTRLMTALGGWLPASAWTNRLVLGALGRAAGPTLHAGQLRLAGTAPNGQRFMIAPSRVWSVAGSRAVLGDVDLGPVAPLPQQPRLAGFRPPQRGLFVVGSGHFENFDAARHHAVDRTVSWAQ